MASPLQADKKREFWPSPCVFSSERQLLLPTNLQNWQETNHSILLPIMNANLFLANFPPFGWSDRHILANPLEGTDAAAVVSSAAAAAAAAASCHAQSSPGAEHSSSSPQSSNDEELGGAGGGFASSCLFIFLAVSLLYVLLALITNLIACYNFVVAWNLITRMYHVDLTFVSQRRRMRRNHSRRGHRYEEENEDEENEYGDDVLHNDGSDDTHTPLPPVPPPHRGTAGPFALRLSPSLGKDGNDESDHAPARSSSSAPPSGHCCPICLEDLPAEVVSSSRHPTRPRRAFGFVTATSAISACDGGRGCGYRFHRKCLREWLERSDTCPCCRRDLTRDVDGDDDNDDVMDPSLHARSWCHDLTVFLGYAPPY